MHAHAHTRGCILYGNRLSGAAQAGFARSDGMFCTRFGLQVWNVAFARICELNGPHFDFEGCEFPPMSDKVPARFSLSDSRPRSIGNMMHFHARP